MPTPSGILGLAALLGRTATNVSADPANPPGKSYMELLEKAGDRKTPPPEYQCYPYVKHIGDDIPDGLEVMRFRTNGTCEVPNEDSLAFLWHDGSFLHVCAVMQDSDVTNPAVGRHSTPHAKGDVMELFFQPADQPNYYELHVAPSLATLEMTTPSVEAFRTGLGGKPDFLFDSGMTCEVGTFTLPSGLAGWWGHMKVPLDKLGTTAEKLAGAKFAVCRYNYNSAWGREPEVSTTATFREGGFHQPSKWIVMK